MTLTPAGTAPALLRELFSAALAAADPAQCLAGHLPDPPAGRTVVIGAGKAAASMVRVFEGVWPGPCDGLAVTRYGHGCATSRIPVVEAAHPVPDAAGVAAARRILGLVQGLGERDLVVLLLSGGGSALLSLPAPGLELADKQAVNAALLRSGADIAEINCVRKHLSAVKGGRLAQAAFPAPVVTLAISDVVGDDPASIASGPTVGDPTTLAEARAVLDRYGIAAPSSVRRHLADPAAETPKPGDPRLARAMYRLVATPRAALDAAARQAATQGYRVIDLGDGVDGDARQVAGAHAGLACRLRAEGVRACILSGGETTVVVRGRGRGGRNSEYLLALARALGRMPGGAGGIHALACDTDGLDGSEDNAGAVIGPTTLSRAAALGLDPARHSDDNDAYGFFAGLGDLVVTGPTLTNVNDFRAILVEP